MDDPGAMNLQDLELIREVYLKYPFSPVFAALYVKVLHNLKDLSYDEALRQAAIILPDRGTLYQLIYREPTIKENIVVKDDLLEELIFPVEEEIKEEQSVAIDSNSIEIPVEVVQEPANTDEPEISSELKELDQDVLIEAINTSIQLDVDQLLEEEVSDSLKDWTASSIHLDKEETKEISKPTKFSDWLFAMKDTEASMSKSQEKPALLSSADLIERFIKTKPRKIDVTKEPVTPQEMGKLSLVEDEGFVTETLAEIYAKQGKYHKAIKIYEQLSLKNPEKKVFFASRIRFLREKLEYDK